MQTIGIIGGGVAGLASAIELSKLNYRVLLFEKHSFAHKPPNNFLTFNFTINFRGASSLKELGLLDDVKARSTPLVSRVIHSKKSRKVQKYSSKKEFVLYSIPRFDLLNVLYKEAKSRENVEIYEQCTVADIKTNKSPVSIEYLSNGEKKTEHVDFVVAADGANSFVRTMFKEHFKPAVTDFEWGYIEVTIEKNEFQQISRKSLHVWPGSDFLCVGIPNQDETVSMLYLSSFCHDDGGEGVKQFIEHARNTIKKNIGNIEALSSLDRCKRIGRIKNVKCTNWYLNHAVLLIGDAAHAFCPFYGQGMNASLQDACVLRNLLEHYPLNRVFEEFYNARRPSMDVLSSLSNKHFYRLKDKFHSSLYNAIYKLDFDLSRKYPALWLHEYTKLSNSCDPIVTIDARIKKQKILKFNPIYALLCFYYLLKEVWGKLNRNFKF